MGNKISKRKRKVPQEPIALESTPTPPSQPTKSTPQTHSPPPKKSAKLSVSKRKIEDLFESYAKDHQVMQPQEVVQFCEDLEVDPEDVRFLFKFLLFLFH